MNARKNTCFFPYNLTPARFSPHQLLSYIQPPQSDGACDWEVFAPSSEVSRLAVDGSNDNILVLAPPDNVVGLSLQSGAAQDTWCLHASPSPDSGKQREKCGFSPHRIVDKIIIIIIIIEIKEENCRPPIFIQRTTHFHGQMKRPGWNSKIEYPRNLQCDWLERGEEFKHSHYLSFFLFA